MTILGTLPQLVPWQKCFYNVIKIDWNVEDLRILSNVDYWYDSDFMRAFTLLLAAQYDNDAQTIIF